MRPCKSTTWTANTSALRALALSSTTALDGLNSTPGIALHTYNMPNSTFDGLDLSYPGSNRSGSGLYQNGNMGANVTIQNVTATNRNYGFDMHGGGQDLDRAEQRSEQ